MKSKNIEIDYSKLTLDEIIWKRTKHKLPFRDLGDKGKASVLKYIEEHNIPIRVFYKKWFDVLSGCFYADEYVYFDSFYDPIDIHTHKFSNFDDYYKYTYGDIYENACYFGFYFEPSVVRKYHIDLKRLNFDSFIHKTIDSYSFEALTQLKLDRIEEERKPVKEMLAWLGANTPICSSNELTSLKNKFLEKFSHKSALRIFFSYFLNDRDHQYCDVLIDYLCVNDVDSGLSFDDLLIQYGKETALKVIENFIGKYSQRTRKSRINDFHQKLNAFESESLSLTRRSGFSKKLNLFYSHDDYFIKERCWIWTTRYFESFSELKQFTNNNLGLTSLQDANISWNELNSCRYDESSSLPQKCETSYATYTIHKYCRKDMFFCVSQKWFDSSGSLLELDNHSFSHFFDFVHFLNNDLSNANLTFCNGIENIKHLKGLILSDLRVRSFAAEALGLAIVSLPNYEAALTTFKTSMSNEVATIDSFIANYHNDNDFKGIVSYITDIHLLHRLQAMNCKNDSDVTYALYSIAKIVGTDDASIKLIGGDTSSDFTIFKRFLKELRDYRRESDYFFVLGNHELWALNDDELPSIINKYRETIDEICGPKMHLIHNSVFYYDTEWREISEERLSSMSVEELKDVTRCAYCIIFGGIGFSGMNERFNANNDIYLNVIGREQEICESEKFLSLYKKVVAALGNRNLIVLTHMPLKDWAGDNEREHKGVVYVNGHNHKNYYYDDGIRRVYSDNQIGYKGQRFSMKRISVCFSFEWFADYEDGIYEITKNDYEKFYRGIREAVTFNRPFKALYMIKRQKTYMFLMRTEKGTLQILNGGLVKNAGDHDLDYYYDHLMNYAISVDMFLSKYNVAQKNISNEIKRIGGDGYIHGCIVDIDFYNHIYLNPLDGSITPYFATSMTDKYVYDNVLSLLYEQRPQLYENYQKSLSTSGSNPDLVLYAGKSEITTNKFYVSDRSMYKLSRILRGLQFTTQYSVVRLWNDAVIEEASEENGKKIVSGFIDINER